MRAKPGPVRCGIALALLLSLVTVLPVGADATTLILLTDPIPASHTIDGMPANGQWWNLSCEYAATSAATAYYGKAISQQTFADDIGFDPNPNIGFRGNLSGPWGGTTDYGIYPGPILKDLIAHGFAHSYSFRANADMLRAAISKDHPVVVWIVGTFGSAPRYDETSDGESYFLVPYEHAVTAYGYTESSILLMDPAIGGYRTVSWPTFMSAWTQLDGMALVVAT
jgi:uncharacterized protein YvpB